MASVQLIVALNQTNPGDCLAPLLALLLWGQLGRGGFSPGGSGARCMGIDGSGPSTRPSLTPRDKQTFSPPAHMHAHIYALSRRAARTGRARDRESPPECRCPFSTEERLCPCEGTEQNPVIWPHTIAHGMGRRLKVHDCRAFCCSSCCASAIGPTAGPCTRLARD